MNLKNNFWYYCYLISMTITVIIMAAVIFVGGAFVFSHIFGVNLFIGFILWVFIGMLGMPFLSAWFADKANCN